MNRLYKSTAQLAKRFYRPSSTLIDYERAPRPKLRKRKLFYNGKKRTVSSYSRPAYVKYGLIIVGSIFSILAFLPMLLKELGVNPEYVEPLYELFQMILIGIMVLTVGALAVSLILAVLFLLFGGVFRGKGVYINRVSKRTRVRSFLKRGDKSLVEE